ncbi:unnamed protein product [Acanthoscelides obtectus]|uniref:Uncharacterized protein n=1 Tax=Acanthoscelides obtectus TaxID=200917 RepID=A0A9P0L2F3_ACAOB|nr:unnamed protein product [Acanthoscelides obtectus]CAK1668734.1 hypothetical protein AOBTE_LOCUS26570 [Acanthoscelides obtectus]
MSYLPTINLGTSVGRVGQSVVLVISRPAGPRVRISLLPWML